MNIFKQWNTTEILKIDYHIYGQLIKVPRKFNRGKKNFLNYGINVFLCAKVTIDHCLTSYIKINPTGIMETLKS